MPSFLTAHRLALYGAVNLAFALVIAVGNALHGAQGTHFLYLFLMFALCSSVLLVLESLNGPYALLALFAVDYFVSFGAIDVIQLFSDAPVMQPSSNEVLSRTESVILVGGLILMCTYRLVVYATDLMRNSRPPKDWSMRSILIAGPVAWAIGTYATYDWYVHIVTDTTNDAVLKGLKSVGPLIASAYILMQMLQPIGILLIAYAWRTFARRAMLPVVIAMVVLQVALGFVTDMKGTAMIAGVLVIVACVLIDGRLPKTWLAGFVIFVVLVFPVFQAYRIAIHGDRGLARTAVIANFGKVLELTLSQTEKLNTGNHRAQTFLERSSVKGSAQLIVQGTGLIADYQHGHTLTPILAAFVPRVFWPDKPDIPTGQLLNKEFHVSEGTDVFLSPSHIGELYWNFGWPGVIFGMAIIGALLGWVGACFNLSKHRTVTRILVTVVTIKQLVVGFEGVIAPMYVVWLRSLAGIGILHMLLARVPAASLLFSPKGAKTAAREAPSPASERLYPHLLT